MLCNIYYCKFFYSLFSILYSLFSILYSLFSTLIVYSYKAYELIIHSEFPIPEFIPYPADVADVTLRFGEVPERLEAVEGRGVLYQANNLQFLLKLDDVAHYLVQNGNEIIVSLRGAQSDLRVFLLGSALGALLHQRGLLVLHAAALYTPAGAVLFCGVSGAGKSTLLNEFLRRGYPMLVDDVCGVVLADDQPLVLPGYPRTRLWLDSAKKLEQSVQGLERTRPSLEKYERQVPDQYWAEPTPLHKIYLLTSHNQETIEVEAIPRLRGFGVVTHNTYRYQFLEGLAMKAPHFTLVAAVAQRVSVSRVNRPSGSFMLTELADAIEQDLALAVGV